TSIRKTAISRSADLAGSAVSDGSRRRRAGNVQGLAPLADEDPELFCRAVEICNEESSMKFRPLLTAAILLVPINAWAIANPQSGEEIALQSCTMCHAPMASQAKSG